MKTNKSCSNIFLVTAMIFACILLLTQCFTNETENKEGPKPIGRKDFAGSAACESCHKTIYQSHIHTAHYLSSRPALEKYIKGSFTPGHNVFNYDSGMTVVMEKRDSGFYQVGYYGGVERIAKRFDIVVGSGAKGQTYLYRDGNYLVQLPVSYLTAAHQWANSPQYPTYPVLFNRPITSRCLECHTTYAKKISPLKNIIEQFDHDSLILGVDCEKCHGPGARHVAYQIGHPGDREGQFVVNPANFTRFQSLDLCALCHGGTPKKTKPSFSYVAGNRLGDFFKLDSALGNPDSIDSHGNQFGLLRLSKCFQLSSAMTCNTCHNPHENERDNKALFSQRCQTCHNQQHGPVSGMTSSMKSAINNNCIDCHMPRIPSKFITELLPGHKIPTAATIHSHYIRVYPEETHKFITSAH
jgi:hypothetical protein